MTNIMGYHPCFGLTDEYRLRVLRYALGTSVREASEKFNVSKTVIYSWKNRAEELEITL